MNEEELAYFQLEERYYELSHQPMSRGNNNAETYTDLDDPEEVLRGLDACL